MHSVLSLLVGDAIYFHRLVMAMESSRTISALLIGNFSSREFRPLRTSITGFAKITSITNCEMTVQVLQSENATYDLAIIAERWPGEHSRRALEQIQRARPIMRMIAVSGSWCDGQKRSGCPWPGMLHTTWHRWLPHWQEDLMRLSKNRLPSFGLPVSASDHERTLFRNLRYLPQKADGKLIAVCSRREDMADMLTAACRSQGYATAWLDPRHRLRLEGPNAILWEGSANQLDDLQNTHHRYPQAPIMALLDFPRIEDLEQAIRQGAAEIMAKPMHLEDLFKRLAALLDTEQTGKIARRNG